MKRIKTLATTALLCTSLHSLATPPATPMLRIFELGVQADKLAQFDQSAEANLLPSVQNEAGTLAMHAMRLSQTPELAYLFEIYADEASYQAHRAGAPYQGYAKVAPQILTEHKKFIATNVHFLGEKPQPLRLNAHSSAHLSLVELEIKPEQNQAFKQLITQEMAQALKVETGVLAMYAVSTQADPNKWFLLEIYADENALQHHRQTPHFQAYLAESASMVVQKTYREIGWKLLVSKGGLNVIGE